ncbi:MAG: hypothetical protein FJY17_00220 [Bacteroidetes bacterium]|nr:hypothetical protein [Bacteroidota bacterium]
MKIYFKSSRFAKQLNTASVSPTPFLSSKTTTSQFPTIKEEDSAVVLFNREPWQWNGCIATRAATASLPAFTIYFNFSMPDGGRSRLRADQVYRRYEDEGMYKTYFGQCSTIPMDKIPEMYSTIKKIEMLIMNHFGVHSAGLSW